MKQKDVARRRLLGAIAAGTGVIVTGRTLPNSWSRPVVNAVMLPAHAQTSCSGTYRGPTQEGGGCLQPGVCVTVTVLDCSSVEVRLDSNVSETFSGSGALNGQSFSFNISSSANTVGVNGVFHNDGTVAGEIGGGDCGDGSITYTAIMGATCTPSDSL